MPLNHAIRGFHCFIVITHKAGQGFAGANQIFTAHEFTADAVSEPDKLFPFPHFKRKIVRVIIQGSATGIEDIALSVGAEGFCADFFRNKWALDSARAVSVGRGSSFLTTG
jgi:hypothetical protein